MYWLAPVLSPPVQQKQGTNMFFIDDVHHTARALDQERKKKWGHNSDIKEYNEQAFEY